MPGQQKSYVVFSFLLQNSTMIDRACMRSRSAIGQVSFEKGYLFYINSKSPEKK